MPTISDADAIANAPGIRQLFSATKVHVLATVVRSLGEKLTPIADRATHAWEALLTDVSRQTLDCFHSRRPRNNLYMVSDLQLLVASTTLPCSRDDAPIVFRNLCPNSEHPYISFILQLINRHDSEEFDYLIHTVITCNPETGRMSLQLGIFPNAAQMKSDAPRLVPLEVVTTEERKYLGL